MNTEKLLLALKSARESAGKRNFNQTVDMILTFRDMDLKKPDNQVDFFTQLHHSTGKTVKVCGLVGPEMKEAAKKELDFVVDVDEFEQYAKDKKKIKKLADEYDFFIAQANLMAKVAQTFGRVFGPKNKMPNPKSGCVVPANANLSALKKKLQTTVRVMVKTSLQYQVAIGKEQMDDNVIADNALALYNQIVHHLPSEANNINNTFLKLTMGPAIKVGADEAEK
ncbi:MAG: 50S ribosomal protein L1 [Candidatus Woesearchaeota archaeon]